MGDGRESHPLPECDPLAEVAIALRDAGQWGWIVDHRWQLVSMTDELRHTFGAGELAEHAIGKHLFEADAAVRSPRSRLLRYRPRGGRPRGGGVMQMRSVGRRSFAVAALLVLGVIIGPPVTASEQAGGEVVPVLHEVRIARHDTFDRVVFEFTGTVVPQATIDGPQANGPGVVTADPSGFPVEVDGDQVLTIAMSPAIATYAASLPPGPLYSGPASFSPTDTRNVVHVVQIGDFESVLTWAIGFRSAATPRVSALTAPTRVVVDIPHTAAPAQPVTGAPSFTG